MSWAGFIELGLFLILAGIVLWICFAPGKHSKKHKDKHPDSNATHHRSHHDEN